MSKAMRQVQIGDDVVSTDTARSGIIHPFSTFDDKGRRSSAVHLLPSSTDPSLQNLIVKTNVRVTRLIFDTERDRPRVIGFEFQQANDVKSKISKLLLPKASVYLCSGAIHTPQLLMLSGVGESSKLKSHNIEVVLNNPHVGQHLKDHPGITLSINSPVPIENTTVATMGVAEDFHIATCSGGAIASGFIPLMLPLVPRHQRSSSRRELTKKVIGLSSALEKVSNSV
jgi:choline dehydrogenase-like flavoprotein